MASETKHLLADGAMVELIGPDGSLMDVQIVFRAGPLARLEDAFGGLDAFSEAVKKKPFGTVADVLSVCIGVKRDEALAMIDTRRISEYIDAIGDALAEALGPQDGDSGNAEAPAGNASRGGASTGLRSSGGASTRSASGT